MKLTSLPKLAVSTLAKPFLFPAKQLLKGQRMTGALLGMQVGTKIGARTGAQGAMVGAAAGAFAGLMFGSWGNNQGIKLGKYTISGSGLLSNRYLQGIGMMGGGMIMMGSTINKLKYLGSASNLSRAGILSKAFIGADVTFAGLFYTASVGVNHTDKKPDINKPLPPNYTYNPTEIFYPGLMTSRVITDVLRLNPLFRGFIDKHVKGIREILSIALPVGAEVAAARSVQLAQRAVVNNFDAKMAKLVSGHQQAVADAQPIFKKANELYSNPGADGAGVPFSSIKSNQRINREIESLQRSQGLGGYSNNVDYRGRYIYRSQSDVVHDFALNEPRRTLNPRIIDSPDERDEIYARYKDGLREDSQRESMLFEERQKKIADLKEQIYTLSPEEKLRYKNFLEYKAFAPRVTVAMGRIRDTENRINGFYELRRASVLASDDDGLEMLTWPRLAGGGVSATTVVGISRTPLKESEKIIDLTTLPKS